MSRWTIYDYVDSQGQNLMREWSGRLQRVELAKLNMKIDSLELYGGDLIPGVVSPTGVASIFKLRVRGKVQLRPLLCEGPGRGEHAFTFLLGAKEIAWAYDPPDALALAVALRNDLIRHPDRRRIHERVSR